MLLRHMLIGVGIGVAVETVARVLRLWNYRSWLVPIFNVVVVFGLIMGGLAAQRRGLGGLTTFTIAVAIGLTYEAANLGFLQWWDFPEGRAATPAGRVAIVVVLGLLWGAVPTLTARTHQTLRRAALVTDARSPVDALNEREQLLLGKLADLQQRIRNVEERLGVVRRRKQYLLDKQAMRELHKPPATPAH